MSLLLLFGVALLVLLLMMLLLLPLLLVLVLVLLRQANVVQSLLRAILALRPLPPLPMDLLGALAVGFNAWHTVIPAFEHQVTTILQPLVGVYWKLPDWDTMPKIHITDLPHFRNNQNVTKL